jgi:hypothetical protein
VKLAAARTDYPINFERTAVLTALARSTGAPVPEVLAADDSLYRGRWRYLIAEHIDGVSWRELRPRLTTTQVAAAHQTLAETLLMVQSVRFATFGELDQHGQPAAKQDVVTAPVMSSQKRHPGDVGLGWAGPGLVPVQQCNQPACVGGPAEQDVGVMKVVMAQRRRMV